MSLAFRFLSGLVLAAGLLGPAAGQDWPQWRGPGRTNVSAEKGLRKQWPDAGAERYSRMAEVEGQLQLTFQKVVLDRDHSFVVRVLAKQYVSKAEVLNKELRACQRSA